MTEREKFEASLTKYEVMDRDSYTCQRCGTFATELAHRISKSKPNLKRYGKKVIHHPRNLVASCHDCNQLFLIDNNPVAVKCLVEEIRECNTL